MDPGKCSECDKELVVSEKIRCVYCELSQSGNVNRRTASGDTNCGVCNVFTIRDKESLNCELCRRWYHNNCNDVALDDQYCTLVYEAPKNIKWFCDRCIWETEKWINEYTFNTRTEDKCNIALGSENDIITSNNKGKRKLTRKIPNGTCKKAKITKVLPKARVIKKNSRNSRNDSRKITRTSIRNKKVIRPGEIDNKKEKPSASSKYNKAFSESGEDNIGSDQSFMNNELMIKEESVSYDQGSYYSATSEADDKEFQPEEANTDSDYYDSKTHSKKKIFGAASIKYKCDRCYKDFNDEQCFKAHKLWHTGDKRPFKCSVCKKGFSSKKLLKTHTIMVHSDEPYICDICGKGFINAPLLKDHTKMVHSHEKPYICDICGKGYTSEMQLEKHIANVFHCDKCSILFQDLQTCEAHKLLHTGVEKPYKCIECNKVFRTKRKLKEHTIMHSDEKPYICDICGKGCKREELLKSHILSHSTEKPISCSECDYRCKSKSALSTHMHSHTREILNCTICDFQTKNKHSMNLHMRKHSKENSDEQLFICDECGNQFKLLSSLKVHQRIHSSERPFKCEICEKGFKQKGTLRVHMFSHTKAKNVFCPVCGFGFPNTSRLKLHLKTVHSDEKPFECERCGNKYKTKHNLNHHQKGIRGTCHETNVHKHPKQSVQKTNTSSESNARNIKSNNSVPFRHYSDNSASLLVSSNASDSNSCESGPMQLYNHHPPPPLLVYTGADGEARLPLYSNSHVTATIHCPPPHLARITGHNVG